MIIKLYRFERKTRVEDSWQDFLVKQTTPPSLDEDLYYLSQEIMQLPYFERKYWHFAFTKKQFIRANKQLKRQLKFCSIPIPKWNPKDKLNVVLIPENHIILFSNQTVYNEKDAITV